LRHEAHEGEKIRNESFARKNRLDKAQRTLQELHEACWEAEFVFGEDMNAYIRPLAEAYQKLFDSITGYFADQLHRGGQKHPDKTHSAYYIVYSEDEDDEFGASLETNIKDLVEFVNKQVES
jgi:phage terminase Nu1 subunit (DNA packaging protein)